jgi:hypothetical protein
MLLRDAQIFNFFSITSLQGAAGCKMRRDLSLEISMLLFDP